VSDLLNDLTDKEIVFEYLYKGFHNHRITGMDVCEQRPLVATCSQQDSTIRIWNYKNFSCKLLRMFYFKVREEFDCDRPLITLAFHPSGYYLAVGCVDKLRFFHVLNAELRPYRELGVRSAHIVKFSRGGHLLAACFPAREEASVTLIKVFNALTLEEVAVLKDHQSPVRSLEFKKYDECLLSAGEEGAIVEWRVADWSRTRAVVRKEMKYSCCIYWHARNSVVAFGEFRGKKYL
jgi:cilia- and flagella-associated protein 57